MNDVSLPSDVSLNALLAAELPEIEPRYVRVDRWTQLTGIGPRTTTDLIGKGELRAIKVGRATLIDYAHGLEWLRNRPAAKILPQKRPPRPPPDQAA